MERSKLLAISGKRVLHHLNDRVISTQPPLRDRAEGAYSYVPVLI